jgi:Type IV secretion system pilin
MRIFARIAAFLGSTGFLVQKAAAQIQSSTSGGTSGNGGGDLNVPEIPGLSTYEGTDGIINAIVDIIVIILDFVLLLAVLFVIIAGIRLIISGGDEGQKDTAKKTIIYVIAGIIIILLARVIVTFVASLL